MGTGTRQCFIWREGQAKRSPNEIGSCLNIFLKRNSARNPIVIYSDNSPGQYKNKFIVLLYMYALIEKQKKCILKRGPIHVPDQWPPVIHINENGEKVLRIEINEITVEAEELNRIKYKLTY
ncbi:hypothetical protein PR048_011923 [Dryococelus australis]|uniref:Uncharacterized protein n=1 Tax=Dryococelus australis TaxID=614101 RepID=A0ABQ9HN67_9NEOP|nr:hypothetical protein PR048_011923 [Dryococelus australis]